MRGVAGLLFLVWVILAAAGVFGWWLLLTPVVLVSLWLARAFEPRTQAWLDEVSRRAYSKIFKI